MAVAPSAIRQQVATSLAGLTGWYESLAPHSDFPQGDSRPKAHKLYSVEVLSTSFDAARRRTSEEQYVTTQLEIKLGWKLKPHSTRDDTDSGLDGIQQAIQEVLANAPSNATLIIQSIQYETDSGNDWMIATAVFDCKHMYALA